jgi:hypothetical protein
VKVTGVTVNSGVWSFVARDGLVDNSTGTVTDILFSSYRGVSGSAAIATVGFEAVKRGKSRMRLEPSAVSPFGGDGTVIPVRYEGAAVDVRGNR